MFSLSDFHAAFLMIRPPFFFLKHRNIYWTEIIMNNVLIVSVSLLSVSRAYDLYCENLSLSIYSVKTCVSIFIQKMYVCPKFLCLLPVKAFCQHILILIYFQFRLLFTCFFVYSVVWLKQLYWNRCLFKNRYWNRDQCICTLVFIYSYGISLPVGEWNWFHCHVLLLTGTHHVVLLIWIHCVLLLLTWWTRSVIGMNTLCAATDVNKSCSVINMNTLCVVIDVWIHYMLYLTHEYITCYLHVIIDIWNTSHIIIYWHMNTPCFIIQGS